MAINPALLIAAPMLQDYFVDKTTADALSAGVVTCYQDNSRTTLKNWYYQSGTPGNYTYVTLDNPLTLSAAGTIADPNGNDTIPFFYPYDEDDQSTPQPYYITVVNSDGQQQFVRQNFPFLARTPSINEVPIYNNIIANNVFYHNIGSLNVTNITNTIIAPSQHDGFYAAGATDHRFTKNVMGATDIITFTQFPFGDDPFLPEPTPEYYLNFNCSSTEAGETTKCIQIPLSLHIKTLESVSATFTLWAQNVGGNVNNTLTISILQYLGSNAIETPPLIEIGMLTLSSGWEKYFISFIFPSAEGLTVGTTSDDALYLQIGFPLSATCNINFTKPSIFLSETVPTNQFETYDQIDTIINSPRTGDIRVSLNNFAPYGWVLMNDGTIGNTASNATSRANPDTWNLFFLLWNSVGATYAPMFNSSGSPVSYGANAVADWNANNQISLTKQLGRAIASVGMSSSGGITNWVLGQTAGEQNHTLTIAEMPSHNHPGSNVPAGSTAGVASVLEATTPTGSQPLSIALQGGGGSHNITQPTVFYNVFMKL